MYILASRYNGALYVGVTSNLLGRILQHRAGRFDGHTKKYAIHRLVYFEVAETMDAAFAREKQLKRYRREWKRNLIERQNGTTLLSDSGWSRLRRSWRCRGPRHEGGVTGRWFIDRVGDRTSALTVAHTGRKYSSAWS